MMQTGTILYESNNLLKKLDYCLEIINILLIIYLTNYFIRNGRYEMNVSFNF